MCSGPATLGGSQAVLGGLRARKVTTHFPVYGFSRGCGAGGCPVANGPFSIRCGALSLHEESVCDVITVKRY